MRELYIFICAWAVHYKLRFVQWHNKTFGKISFAKAQQAADAIRKLRPGKKMFIILLAGEYVTIGKKEFKELWKRNPKMKEFTIQEWQHKIYEHTGTS
jgi:hypothetical protein